MISTITVENFNGVKHQEFVFGRVSVVLDGNGVVAPIVFNSLWLLDRLARGMAAARAPYGMICESQPTFIRLGIVNEQSGEIFYEVALQRFGLITTILSEKLYSNDAVLLTRERQSYSLCNSAHRFPIDNSQAALAVAMPFFGKDPITAFRSELTQSWLIMPNLVQMVSTVQFGQLERDIWFQHLPSYIVSQQQAHPIIYGVMMETLRELGSTITGLAVETNSFNAMYLAVQRENRYENKGVPFEFVAQNEKTLILAAFVRAVNECVNPITAVWHSPLNWLGEKEGGKVVKMLARSFAAQGQLIVLSREYDILRGVE